MNDGQPQIDGMLALPGERPSDSFTAGKGVRLVGSRLRVCGDEAGVFLCPADADGNISKGGADWTRIDSALFSCNRPRCLEFFIPDGQEPGRYRILLKTFFCKSNVDRKTAISTVSPPITIRSGMAG